MVPGGQQSKRNGGEHEDNCAPGGDSGEQGGGDARTECGLAARAAEGGGNIRALAMLQQHNNDQDRAYKHMNRGEENNHVVVLEILSRIMVRKGGFEPPRLSAPPPQDGVSASSTTSAGRKTKSVNKLQFIISGVFMHQSLDSIGAIAAST